MNTKKSTLIQLLAALLPYTEDNLKIAFRPSLFFSDLEMQTGANRRTLASTLSRAQKQGLVKRDGGVPILTSQGKKRVVEDEDIQFVELEGTYRLMVAFDVPQSHDIERRQFVAELKHMHFTQLQKSVWISKYDHEQYVIDLIAELKLGRFTTISLTQPIYGF